MGNRAEREHRERDTVTVCFQEWLCFKQEGLWRGVSLFSSSHCLGHELERRRGMHTPRGESCACWQERENWKQFVKMAKGSLLTVEFCHSCYWQAEDKDGCLWMANSIITKEPGMSNWTEPCAVSVCPALNNLHPQISIRTMFLC